MRKIIFLLSILFILISCDPAGEIEAITDYFNYFLDIEANKTTGTVNTEFTFKANTNDTLTEWIIDGEANPISRGPKLSLWFTPGLHTVGATTLSGESDSIDIIVSELEIIFRLSSYGGEITTPFYADYPILNFDGTEYNIESGVSGSSVTITETETQRIISISIAVDGEDSFYFINDNAFNLLGIDLNNMGYDNLLTMIDKIHPEITDPVYSQTVFKLTSQPKTESDYLIVYEDRIYVDSVMFFYTDYATYGEDTRYINIPVGIDNKDSFLFINNNMQTFFNIDLSAMSYNELVITADIFNRYPEEGILELQEGY